MERDSNNCACVGQRGGVEPDRLVAHAGGAVGLGPAAVPVARPERLAVGQARASSVACQSLSGVTSRGVTGGCDRAGARDYAAFLGFFFLEPS